MTREEALDYAKSELDAAYKRAEKIGYKGKTRYIEVLEMAIQALSQEPTFDDECQKDMDEAWEQIQKKRKRIPVTLDLTPCEDAISREDAEQMFRNIRSHLKPQDYKSAEEFNTRDLMLLNAEQMIHALPPVTQKSGKWINTADACMSDNIVCSKCGYNSIASYNYCPNCGAKMVEPQESEVRNE